MFSPALHRTAKRGGSSEVLVLPKVFDYFDDMYFTIGDFIVQGMSGSDTSEDPRTDISTLVRDIDITGSEPDLCPALVVCVK